MLTRAARPRRSRSPCSPPAPTAVGVHRRRRRRAHRRRPRRWQRHPVAPSSAPGRARHPDTVADRARSCPTGPARPAITYDPAVVPAGATAQAHRSPRPPYGATVRLTVTGLVPRRAYGAHLHTEPCTATPDEAGPHYQHQPDPKAVASPPSVDPAYANPRNEVWLDFTADAPGRGHRPPAARTGRSTRPHPPRSLIVHAEQTRTGPGKAGTAGPRVACLTLRARLIAGLLCDRGRGGNVRRDGGDARRREGPPWPSRATARPRRRPSRTTPTSRRRSCSSCAAAGGTTRSPCRRRPEVPNYAKRRAALSDAFPGETLIIPTGTEKVRANDTDYPFRPGSDFVYLTGDRDPDSVLVLRPERLRPRRGALHPPAQLQGDRRVLPQPQRRAVGRPPAHPGARSRPSWASRPRRYGELGPALAGSRAGPHPGAARPRPQRRPGRPGLRARPAPAAATASWPG